MHSFKHDDTFGLQVHQFRAQVAIFKLPFSYSSKKLFFITIVLIVTDILVLYFKPSRNLCQRTCLLHTNSSSQAITVQRVVFFFNSKVKPHVISINSFHLEGRNELLPTFHLEMISGVTNAINSSILALLYQVTAVARSWPLQQGNNPEADPHLYTCSVTQLAGFCSSGSTSPQATTYHRLNIYHLKHQATENIFP